MKRSIMTYQKSSSLSYDSIGQDEEQQQQVEDEEQAIGSSHCTSSSSTTRQRQRARLSLLTSSTTTSTVVVVIVTITTLLLLALLFVAPHIPSQQERDIAAAYDMPLWGSVRHIRQAVASTATAADVVAADFSSIGVHDILKKQQKQHDAAKGTTTATTTTTTDAVDKYLQVPVNCEMTVLLIRHCEKKNIREHCDYTGYERSVYLASLFGNSEKERWPLPALIFAEGPGGRHNRHKMNFRELETVGPLAEKAGVSIDDSFDSDNINDMTREILSLRPALCGQTVVVSWKHSDMGHLARHLGCGPLQGCPVDYNGKTFDEVWQIKFVYTEMLHSDRKSLAKDKHPSWHVFGSVQHENFDPLAFSKAVGDYPAGGTATGGRWEKQIVDIPERTDKDWKKVYWQATNVGGEHHHHA